MRRRSAVLGFLAVAGPGMLAGLSDDDPAGITTYSVMGADYGYELLWVLLLATAALIVFHSLAVRIGVATGQGLAGLVRERFGVRLGALALVALIVANVGTTAAELAGVAAGTELAGVSRYASVPVAAAAVSLLVLRGGFRRIEHVLLAISTVFVTYVASGLIVRPDLESAARGLVVPALPGTRDAVLIATAAVGTTLAPWGLAFIQSYAVDKRLRPADFRLERVDVAIGAVLTGVIGAFIILACAATLHADGRSIDDAADAAQALRPLAGGLASWLFGAGLLGAALLAAAILPLSTAYSVSEALGREAALDDRFREAPLFYRTYAGIMGLGVLIVLLPGVDLIGLLVLTQALNAVLLLPLLVFIYRLARDSGVMGDLAIGRGSAVAALATIAGTALCVGALGAITIAGWLP